MVDVASLCEEVTRRPQVPRAPTVSAFLCLSEEKKPFCFSLHSTTGPLIQVQCHFSAVQSYKQVRTMSPIKEKAARQLQQRAVIHDQPENISCFTQGRRVYQIPVPAHSGLNRLLKILKYHTANDQKSKAH